MIKDMSVGIPYKILLKFSFPMIISMMFQQLYNIADSVIAGRLISMNALAAVGASNPITSIFISVSLGFSVGTSVVVANYFGARNYRDLKSAVSTTTVAGIVLAVITTLLGSVLYVQIMNLIKTPSEIFVDSAEYLKIYIYGFAFMLFYNVANSVSVALGDSKTPLFFLIFSSVLNVILDIVFVKIGMGVKGIAWATFIAQGLSAVLAVAFMLYRLSKIKSEKYRIFDGKIFGQLMKIGIPSIIQQSFISVGLIAIQGLVNAMGAIYIAAYASALKVNVFIIASLNTMSNAVSAYTAQNIGARKPERVSKGMKSGFIIVEVIAAFLVLVLVFFSKSIIGVFVNPDEPGIAEVVKNGAMFLYIMAPAYLIFGIKVICDGVLRGTGEIMRFMITTIFDLVIRIAFSYILAPSLGFLGIALSYPIGWALGTIISLLFYLSVKKKRLNKITTCTEVVNYDTIQ